jgi:general secretion pathway protein K
LARDDKAKDSLDEDWAVVLPPIVVEGGSVAGRIEDMQSRFNINNLVDNEGKRSAKDVAQFINLLHAVGLDDELASPLVDWLDKDNEPTFDDGWGAEDDEYSSYPVPYRTANQLLQSPSELMLVKGFTAEVYQALAPFITALPTRTKINVNTAAVEVIMSLSPDITRSDAQAAVASREETPFESAQAFVDLNAIPQNAVQADTVAVTSNYFLMDATARYGERGKAHMYSLLVRDGGKVNVIMRTLGVY